MRSANGRRERYRLEKAREGPCHWDSCAVYAMRLDLRLKAEAFRALARIRMGRANIERSLLYAVYGEEIIKQLRHMHAHPDRCDPDRALVVALNGARPAYVRCMFADRGAIVQCECFVGRRGTVTAESGSGPPEEVAAGLRTAGYWEDSDGRYVFPYELDEALDDSVWGGAAVAILNPLIDVFGATSRSNIDIIAPNPT